MPAAPEPCADSRTLAECAADRDVRVSTFLWSPAGTPGEEVGFHSALAEFDLYTVPLFFKLLAPDATTRDWSLVDAVADAAPPGTMLYVPGIVTNDPQLNPDWVADLDGEQLRPILVALVHDVVTHFETKYPGRVAAYELVLEPLSWKDRAGLWNRLGLDAGLDRYEYIRVAFRTARAAAPNAVLYVNDFGVEWPGAKADEYYALVDGLVAEQVPIDGVAFEGHFMLGGGGSFPAPPPADELAANLDRFGSIVAETQINSVDISFRDADASPAMLDAQAIAYASVVQGCVASASCRAFGTWGIGDIDSWILMSFPGWGSPLLFDTRYREKPAYAAVHGAL